MRILITIPHYYRAEAKALYGSLQPDPQPRIASLTSAIYLLYQNFQAPHCVMNIARQMAEPADQSMNCQVDIVICTTGKHHLLDKINVPPPYYRHYSTQAEPRMLGFECQAVLRDSLGKYDYYCFMEDDLGISDPLFFQKLYWFTSQSQMKNLLQPNRFEKRVTGPFFKGYIDGENNIQTSDAFQNIRENYQISAQVMGGPMVFRRTTNPHSGCYFLSAEQMAYWAEQVYFLDRDSSYVDPMASAATLGIMKTFHVYKPGVENACFLEIEHLHRGYLYQAGEKFKIDEEKFRQIGYALS